MHRRGLLLGAPLATGLATPSRADEPGSLLERFAAALTTHDIDAFAALFAEDYVNHQLSAAAPPQPGKPDKQATVDFFAARVRGLPDLSVAIEASLAAADRAAASFLYTGTHTAPYFGVAPTGRRLRFSSCDIFRIQDGRIAEHWGMGDIAGVLAQLRA